MRCEGLRAKILTNMINRLKKLLKSAVVRGDFTLTSGKKAEFYINGRNITLTPEGAYLSGKLMLDALIKDRATAVGGPTIGADPIVGSIACLAHIKKYPLKTFIVRKSQKAHGDNKLIEGPALNKKDRIILVDDTATTGKSIMESAQIVRSMGYKASKALVLVDREEGAKENLKKIGIKLSSLFIARDLLEHE